MWAQLGYPHRDGSVGRAGTRLVHSTGVIRRDLFLPDTLLLGEVKGSGDLPLLYH